MDTFPFLLVKCGDLVVISTSSGSEVDWWVGYIISRVGNSTNPMINTLFQVVDVDTGKVLIVNADLVVGII